MSGSTLQPKDARVLGSPKNAKIGNGWPQVMWVNEITGFIMVDTAVTPGAEVEQADDKIIALDFLDPGTCNERINTIITSSVSIGQTVTDTFAYTLVNGKYVPSGVTRAVA